jgi:hypothetical protein
MSKSPSPAARARHASDETRAFEASLDLIVTGVVLVDGNAKIIHANCAARAMLLVGSPLCIAGFFTELRKTAEQLTALELEPDPQRGLQKISARTNTDPATPTLTRRGRQLRLRTAFGGSICVVNTRI